MTARLPVPGQDDGTWGSILNAYLQVSLDANGNLLTSALQQAGGVTASEIGSANGVASLDANTHVPLIQLGAGTASSSNFLRGDGTWAVPSGGGGGSTLTGDSDVSIATPSNNQVLTYNGTSGKWTNQTPASAPVATVFGRSGAVVATSGDYTAAEVTNAADKSAAAAQSFTGNLSAPAIVAAGLTGAAAASRYVGATVSGAPTSGTFAVGDFVIDQTGKIWICTTAPDSWTQGGGSSLLLDTTAIDIKALGSQSAGVSTKAAAADHVHPTTGLALLAGATFTGGVIPAVATLTYSSTISVNAANGNDFRVTLTGTGATIANPTNPTDGQRITFQLTQDSTGSRTVTWGSAYNFGTGGTPVLSTAANLTDVIGFVYNATKTQWLAAGAALGF